MSNVLHKKEPVWQLQQAKAQFSEVVNCALKGEPQLVTRSGHPSVYIVSVENFQSEREQNGLNRKEILLSSPAGNIKLNVSREKNDGREVAL